MCAYVFVCECDMLYVCVYARMDVYARVSFLCVVCKYTLCMIGAAQQCVHMHVCVMGVYVQSVCAHMSCPCSLIGALGLHRCVHQWSRAGSPAALADRRENSASTEDQYRSLHTLPSSVCMHVSVYV